MHPSALKFGALFFDTYVDTENALMIVDIGSQDVNGSLRDISPKNSNYVGVDFVEGKNVDIVLSDPYKLPFDENSVDIVVCSSVFEHSQFFWLLFLEIIRVLKPEGLMYLNAPSNGYIHRYPVDCWRFYPDAGLALVSWAKFNGHQAALLESFIGDKNLKFESSETWWNDYCAVFVKDSKFSSLYKSRMLQSLDLYANARCDDILVDQKEEFLTNDFSLLKEKDVAFQSLKIVLLEKIAEIKALTDNVSKLCDPQVFDDLYKQNSEYLKKLAESEVAASDWLQQIVDAHFLERSKLTVAHQERESCQATTLAEAHQQIKQQLTQATALEKSIQIYLKELRENDDRRQAVQANSYAASEVELKNQLRHAKDELILQVLKFDEIERQAEKKSQQLAQLHEQRLSELINQHQKLERTSLAQLFEAKAEGKKQLLAFTAREREHSTHISQIHAACEKNEFLLKSEFAKKEKLHAIELKQTKQRFEEHLLKAVTKEKQTAHQIQSVRQTAELRRYEHVNELLIQEKSWADKVLSIEEGHSEVVGRYQAKFSDLQQEYFLLVKQGSDERADNAQKIEFVNQQCLERCEAFQIEIENVKLDLNRADVSLATLQESYIKEKYSWTEATRISANVVAKLNEKLEQIHQSFWWRIGLNFRKPEFSEKDIRIKCLIPAVCKENMVQQTVKTSDLAYESNSEMNIVLVSNSNEPNSRVDNLLKLNGEDFIREAYLVVLGRQVDPTGLTYYSRELLFKNDKLGVIASLRWSEESIKRKLLMPDIDNLIRYKKIVKNPLVGGFLGLFGETKKRRGLMKSLISIEEKVSQGNETIRSELNGVRELVEKLDAILDKKAGAQVVGSYAQLEHFEPDWYLNNYLDVKETGINPYEHFVRYGINEGRQHRSGKNAGSNNYVTKINYDTGTKVEEIIKLEESSGQSLKKLVKIICFYLPQYHPIPENDLWWSKGFTEWTNVRPAKAQFRDHYQPRIPSELGYYSLIDKKTQRRQVELAKNYGVEGFCFYYYWFGGERLLEKPVENYLNDPLLSLPFCLCWANENWSRRWDGLDSEVLIAQKHSTQDDIAFIDSVIEYMKDQRYIRVEGKPLLLVYRPSLLPSAMETAVRWREQCRKRGVGEIYLAYTQSFEKLDPSAYGFDAAVEFPPNNSNIPDVTKNVVPLTDEFEGKVYDWTALVERSKRYERVEYTLFRGVCPSWDNTARRKNKGSILVNSSPHKYQEWLCNSIRDTNLNRDKADERLVFINAWNEWAEGAYLEPDERYGYAYLEATRMAQLRCAIAHDRATGNTSNYSPTVAVVIHAFYPDILREIVAILEGVKSAKLHFYVTCPIEVQDEVRRILNKQARKFDLLISKNKGRDILPFIKVMNKVLAGGHQYFVKVHTKKSTHRLDGEQWRKELYDQLITEDAISTNIRYLNSNIDIGILGPVGHVVPMHYYFGSNIKHVHALSNRLGMACQNLESLSFVAGTMFTARVSAVLPLLALGFREQDFEEEKSQTDGTLAHGIERALSVSAWACGLSVASLTHKINIDYAYAARVNDGLTK